MDILQDLWMGNIAPAERTLRRGTPYYEAQVRMTEIEQELRSGMDSEQKKLLEQYTNLEIEALDNAETEAFVWGFRLGAQILLAALEK